MTPHSPSILQESTNRENALENDGENQAQNDIEHLFEINVNDEYQIDDATSIGHEIENRDPNGAESHRSENPRTRAKKQRRKREEEKAEEAFYVRLRLQRTRLECQNLWLQNRKLAKELDIDLKDVPTFDDEEDK